MKTIITKHCLDRYQKIKPNYNKLALQAEILQAYARASSIEIPSQFKLTSLINNEFKPVSYKYDLKSLVLFVVRHEIDLDILVTCYTYTQSSNKNRSTRQSLIKKSSKLKNKRKIEKTKKCSVCNQSIITNKYEQHIKHCG
jgi:hypothetical protein